MMWSWAAATSKNNRMFTNGRSSKNILYFHRTLQESVVIYFKCIPHPSSKLILKCPIIELVPNVNVAWTVFKALDCDCADSPIGIENEAVGSMFRDIVASLKETIKWHAAKGANPVKSLRTNAILVADTVKQNIVDILTNGNT